MKNISIFCLLSLVLIFPGTYLLFEHAIIAIKGEMYQGRISGFTYKSGSGMTGQKRGTTYPRVKFVDNSNKKREQAVINMEFYFKKYSKDEIVSVFYDKETKRLIINDIYSLWSQPLFLIILGGLICYFGRNLKPTYK